MSVHRRRSFTLVELLVVISIIMILASMLLPVLKKGQLAAKTSACMDNLKRNVMVCHLYADDEDGWFPTTTRFEIPWMVSIASYLGPERKNLSWRVRDKNGPPKLYPTLDCPVYPIRNITGVYYRGNYGYNIHSTTYVPTGGNSPEYVRARDNIVAPTLTPLIFDAYNVTPDSVWREMTKASLPFSPPDTSRAHVGMTLNFGFMDGNVEAVRAGDRRDLQFGNSLERKKIIGGWTGLE